MTGPTLCTRPDCGPCNVLRAEAPASPADMARLLREIRDTADRLARLLEAQEGK